MRSVIKQSVVLPAPAKRLFEMYLDPTMHEAVTGAPVTIARAPGSPFSAFNGALSGQILVVDEPALIVQSWRSSAFKSGDPDSTLILFFKPEQSQGRIELIHLDVPEHDHDGVTQGWQKFYWSPWLRYLTSQP